MAEELNVEVKEVDPNTVLGEPEKEVKPEGTPEGDNKDATPPSKDVDDDKDKLAGAPDKYEDFTFPEDMQANDERVTEFVDIAKDLNLTQEQAQKLVDIQSKYELEAVQERDDAFNTMIETWLNEAKADKDLGGAAFDENVADAKKAIDEFGSQGLIDILDSSGAGNHPEVLKFLSQVGKLIAEDRIHGGSGVKTEVDIAKVLYPTMSQ